MQIAHVIREIRQFQQTPYKIEAIPRAISYLLDPEKLLGDENLYQKSLGIEPRVSPYSQGLPHVPGVPQAPTFSSGGGQANN